MLKTQRGVSICGALQEGAKSKAFFPFNVERSEDKKDDRLECSVKVDAYSQPLD